ncbi:MAG: chitin disaccharide deacetylase [Deferrisomatales bacterium]
MRSASVVAGGPTAAAFVERALALGLDLGLHVNLTEGRAVAGPAPTLTDAAGRFLGPKGEVWRRAAAGRLDAEAVRAEVWAQWNRLCSLGAVPSHVDGHNHVHLFPAVRAVLEEWREAVWVRVPDDRRGPPGARPELPGPFERWTGELGRRLGRVAAFTGFVFSRDPSAETFLRSLDPPVPLLEFMVHPGRRSGSPFAASSRRDRETRILCAPRLRQKVEARGWRPASFQEVSCASPS